MSDTNLVGAAEAEVGRYVYSLIEARMDARPGTTEATELEYLAAIVADVEEYGADELTVDQLRAAPASPVLAKAAEAAPTDEQIKHMVGRFLAWKLPQDFRPDGGITFKAEFNEHTAHPMRHEPMGTNLLDARQAEVMVRHMVEGLDEPDDIDWKAEWAATSSLRVADAARIEALEAALRDAIEFIEDEADNRSFSLDITPYATEPRELAARMRAVLTGSAPGEGS